MSLSFRHQPAELLGSYGLNSPPVRHDNRETMYTALLNFTQVQLEEERRLRARTREEADAEICRLRAMVARRDAELEACATHFGHRELLFSVMDPILPSVTTHTRADCYCVPTTTFQRGRVLSHTATHQRTLERDIESLQRQVGVSLAFLDSYLILTSEHPSFRRRGTNSLGRSHRL